MNIKDYKNAYDGIRATKSLKKRVMDAAEQADEDPHRDGVPRKNRKRTILLSVLGGAAGIAAAFAFIIFGSGFFRNLFSEDRSIVVTVSERPDPIDYSALAPRKEAVGELSSPKLRRTLDNVYETMPALTVDEAERTMPFRTKFVTFPDTLTEAAGKEAFAEWIGRFISLPPYYTFYNNPNLLSYVVYFDISEEKARELLRAAGGFTEDEIEAVAARKEELCRRLFINDELPMCTYNEREGYLFYTVENLYEMPSEPLAELFRQEGYTASEPPEPMNALREWANTLEDPIYSAAVERKCLLVSAALFEDGKPSLPEDSILNAIYDPAVSDFNETLDFNGVKIYNYVLKLVKDQAPDDLVYRTAVIGANSEPNGGTIPNYRRLLTIRNLGITEEMLGEALDMINRHYYGQTGEIFYPEEALQTILYGTDEEFYAMFVSPYTLRSQENPVGTLWLSGATIYNKSVSAWLEYGDLSEKYLRTVEEALDGMQKEFFRQKITYYREIRLLTAEKLDGGAMAADEALIELPELPETLRPVLAFERYGDLSGAGIYNATLTELASYHISGDSLLDTIRTMIDEHEELQAYEYKAPLLRKAYLYLWHTDGVNLYCDEYLETLDLFMTSNYTARTDGRTLYIGYGNADLPDWANAKAFTDYAAEHHLIRTAPYSEYPSAEPQTGTHTFHTPSSVFLTVNPNPILPNAAERGIWACAGFGHDPWLKQEHFGLDFAVAAGDEIAAIADGFVIHAGEKGDFGQCVILDHGNGMQSIYAHCSALSVTTGETVKAGTIVAAVGSTGYSTGPHLHFEIRQNDVPIDPTPYLNSEAKIIPDLSALSDEPRTFEVLPDQPSVITVNYSERLSAESKRLCTGVMLTAPEGSAIAAIADGTVAAIQNDEQFGVMVSIEHGEGYEICSRYASCADIQVKVGDPIRKGEVFAAVGETGQLFFELDSGGAPFDPTPYLDGTESASEMIAAQIHKYEERKSGT